MIIQALTHILEQSGAVEGFWDKLDAGEDATLGLAASARPFFVAAQFTRNPRPTLVVVAGSDAAALFARDLSAYLGESSVLLYPERSENPFLLRPGNPDEVACRMEALHSLRQALPRVVVASVRALQRRLPPLDSGFYRPLVLRAGSAIEDGGNPTLTGFDDIPAFLELRGYHNTGELTGPGSFCLRGGIIDVHPGNSTFPVRLDFFGDTLDEILRIVPSTGQTIARLDQVEIYPVREVLVSKRAARRAEEKLEREAATKAQQREFLEKLRSGVGFDGIDSLLASLYATASSPGEFLTSDALSVQIEPRSLFDDASHAFADAIGRAKGSGISADELFLPPTELDFGTAQRATYVSLMSLGATLDAEVPVKRTDVAGNPEKLFGKLRSLVEGSYTVVFSVPDYRTRQELKLDLVDRELSIVEIAGEAEPTGRVVPAEPAKPTGEESPHPETLRKSLVNIVDTDIPLGMIIPKAKIALVSIHDTKAGGRGGRRPRPARRIDLTEVTFPYAPGDYVVHAVHGIALFKEIVRKEVQGIRSDYLLLEYAAGDTLFVPVERFDRVTRYVGADGSSPRLTRLGSADWSRALRRARKATKKMAFDLLDVYSKRAASRGFAYSADTPWQKEMEAAFPYDETPDQLAAIADVKSDMCSPRPMDRLICGDVGFGKTEVALRAAFKATQDGRQVMVLCPTTILAQQHYTNFKDRCEPFGVSVEVLSRFRTQAQQAKILEDFADGRLDILVGTHRLLSRDVNPRELGLLVIDEEQRFGVAHKEQLKNLREAIDVLTLSATPIPRTMQMSLSGVRDMSLILTPPDERKAVKVQVGEWDPDVVEAAVRRELARKGQVYYVSNRVHDINEATERVLRAAPEARVGVAHGQMGKEALERVMEEFSAGELDVLVATTIIESGIDNPHTNTLIIEDSQRLGLSQMYQLKGRVGRSSTQAYAYFMFPEHIPLTEEATARLTSLHEHSDLGSGLKIALRDLEIRGAGNLIGAEQSGNMSSVGFDLFAQMLAQAVEAARTGSEPEDDPAPSALSGIVVNLAVHTYISEEYIRDADERVLLYRRLACADTPEAVDELQAKTLAARPGMPQATINCFEKARVKATALEKGIKSVSAVGGKLIIEPVSPDKDILTKLKPAKALYYPSSKKLSVPLAYFGEADGDILLSDALLPAVKDFLWSVCAST